MGISTLGRAMMLSLRRREHRQPSIAPLSFCGPWARSVEFSLKQITLKAASIMGSIGGTGDFERALAFSHQHPQLAEELVSHRIPFREYERAFELAQDRKKAKKVLIIFD